MNALTIIGIICGIVAVALIIIGNVNVNRKTDDLRNKVEHNMRILNRNSKIVWERAALLEKFRTTNYIVSQEDLIRFEDLEAEFKANQDDLIE